MSTQYIHQINIYIKTYTTPSLKVTQKPHKQERKMENSSSSNYLYRECLRNHAASLGSYATDGCGEFTLDADSVSSPSLQCMACGCHRNFHRKVTCPVVEGPQVVTGGSGDMMEYSGGEGRRVLHSGRGSRLVPIWARRAICFLCSFFFPYLCFIFSLLLCSVIRILLLELFPKYPCEIPILSFSHYVIWFSYIWAFEGTNSSKSFFV